MSRKDYFRAALLLCGGLATAAWFVAATWTACTFKWSIAQAAESSVYDIPSSYDLNSSITFAGNSAFTNCPMMVVSGKGDRLEFCKDGKRAVFHIEKDRVWYEGDLKVDDSAKAFVEAMAIAWSASGMKVK